MDAMLRFAVYDRDGPARKWPLVNAHLLGPDDQPVPGKIRFDGGTIRCRRPSRQASALCLQYDTGAKGRLMLQTCLLPDREKPYILAVELARHRIKTFIAKSEEWQMFDLPADHQATRQWEQARRLVTGALIKQDPLEADADARSSLVHAIEASERLAMAHAETLLRRRFANRPASNATLGVRVWPGRDGRQLRDLIAANFDLVVLPLRWRDLEVEEGVYKWDALDRWIDWAHGEGKPIILGPLVDFSKTALPDWMYVWQHDFDTSRDLVYEYMDRVVARYRSKVNFWNIASGVNVNDNFEFTEGQMLDLARTANLLVRHSRKGARTMVELRQPFGEHGAGKRPSMPPLAFIDRLIQEGVRLDAVGVQLLFGQAGSGQASRDIMQISSMLDRFFFLELPVLVSAMGVPSEPVDRDGGWWRGAWSPETQARWAARLFTVVMSKPYVESVFWTDLYDHAQAELDRAGLIREDGQAKPAFSRLVGMRRRLRRPLGPPRMPEEISP